MDEEIRAALLARCEEDQRIRTVAARSAPGPGIPSPELLNELRSIDEANTLWLTELTERLGWPGQTLVGEDGAHAAWLLAQHADLGHQRKFLDLLRAAMETGKASIRDQAYLEDRVRVRDGQPQRYGTQFMYDQDELKPQPIEDPEHLDQRRAAVGLGPFAEYEALMHRRD